MKRKLPKLHLRDLFWLVLVCALAVGWWRDRTPLASEVERLSLQHYLDLATDSTSAKPQRGPDWDGTPITLDGRR